MGKAEAKIESTVNEYAEEQGFLVRKYASLGVKGAPDRIYYGHGQVFLMEFKTPTGTTSGPQKREIERIRAHGCKVFVVDNVAMGKSIIDGAKISGTRYVK